MPGRTVMLHLRFDEQERPESFDISYELLGEDGQGSAVYTGADISDVCSVGDFWLLLENQLKTNPWKAQDQ